MTSKFKGTNKVDSSDRGDEKMPEWLERIIVDDIWATYSEY